MKFVASRWKLLAGVLLILPMVFTVQAPIAQAQGSARVTAQAASDGGAEGSYSLDSRVDSVTEATTLVSLTPADGQIASSRVTIDKAGTFHMAPGGLSSEFGLLLPLIYWIITAFLVVGALIGGIAMGFNLAKTRKPAPEEEPAQQKPRKPKPPHETPPKAKLPKKKLLEEKPPDIKRPTLRLPSIKLPKLKLPGIVKTPQAEQLVPPAISITDLQIMPDQVSPDTDVGIIATITNNSQTTIEHRVELKINGQVKAFQEISLAPEGSQEVTFITTADTPGEHQVGIGGLTDKFSVIRARESQETISPTTSEAPTGYQAAPDSLTDEAAAISTAEGKPSEARVLRIRLPSIRLPKLKLPGIFRPPKAEQVVPPPISVTDLQIMPDRVTQGSSVGIIAIVTNNSQTTIQHRVALKINDQLKTFLEITLTPGESQEVTFVTTAGGPGDYQVAIDGSTGKFSVVPTADTAA